MSQNDLPPSNFDDDRLREVIDYALREDPEAEERRGLKKRSKRLWKGVKTTARKVKKTAKREREETIIAAQILRRYMRDKDSVSAEELAFLKDQSIDIMRILPIVAVQAFPAPVPITPFLIALGSKIGINLVPKEQVHPDEYRERVPKDNQGRQN